MTSPSDEALCSELNAIATAVFNVAEKSAAAHISGRAMKAADRLAELAAEVERESDRAYRAEKERDEARAIVANVNSLLFGTKGYSREPDCVSAIENLKAAVEQARAAREGMVLVSTRGPDVMSRCAHCGELIEITRDRLLSGLSAAEEQS